MSWITDAAKGKSSTWPQGEPQKIRDAAERDRKEKEQQGKK